MPITVMCSAGDPGATLYTNAGFGVTGESKIYTRTFAHGCVVGEREANYYDDSDFYATYWDAEAGEFKEVMFASTRGWTYAAGAVVDATPEVMAKWEAHLEAKAAERRAYQATLPRVGRMVRIVPNNGKAKHLAGQVGVIFWMQEQRSRYGSWHVGTRVGVRVDDEKAFLDSSKVEVIVDAEVLA